MRNLEELLLGNPRSKNLKKKKGGEEKKIERSVETPKPKDGRYDAPAQQNHLGPNRKGGGGGGAKWSTNLHKGHQFRNTKPHPPQWWFSHLKKKKKGRKIKWGKTGITCDHLFERGNISCGWYQTGSQLVE